MFDVLETARAWEMLHDPAIVGPMNAEDYYKLCLAAGYDKAASKEAARDWGMKRLQKDLPA